MHEFRSIFVASVKTCMVLSLVVATIAVLRILDAFIAHYFETQSGWASLVALASFVAAMWVDYFKTAQKTGEDDV